MERRILEAVARADLAICAALRWIAILLPLALVVLVGVLIVRARLPDPDLIDYDAPGVDITSEGPAAPTAEWYRWEDGGYE